MMANVRAERLLKIPAESGPELRAAAQTRVVSKAGIRLVLGIRVSFQRDNLRRHFWVRVLQPDHVSIRTQSGDAAEEFQKLGRADDGVGDAGGLD
jgi:hypothetical protein